MALKTKKNLNALKIGDGPLRVNENQKEFWSLPGSEGNQVEHSDFLVLTCHLSFLFHYGLIGTAGAVKGNDVKLDLCVLPLAPQSIITVNKRFACGDGC